MWYHVARSHKGPSVALATPDGEQAMLTAPRPVFADAEHLARRMRHFRVPGLSIAVIRDYTLAWAGSAGVLQAGQLTPVQTGTLFQACSISKAVSAVAVMRVVQRGQLDLDADANRYLRAWRIPANDDWQPA